MPIEYKAVHVGGVSEMKDEGNGVVTAYVSVTGVEDNVKDIIEPGAYTRTLKKRTPKGVWSHSWVTPTSKTLAADELPPGHADLPKELSDGSPWPKEAGALRIKMQFNLNTRRGQEAYSDVRFFDKEQEWSIGYTVPDGASFKDSQGRRHIKDLDLFEYSPVLFGANSHARTAVSVKDAQFGAKMLSGVPMLEIKSLEDAANLFRKDLGLPDVDEAAGESFEGDAGPDELTDDPDVMGEDEESGDELDEDDLEAMEDEDEEKTLLSRINAGMSIKDIRAAYTMLGKLLNVIQPDESFEDFIELGTKALIEAKAVGFDSIVEAVDAIDVAIDSADASDLREAASDLDAAFEQKDESAASDAAGFLFDVLEKVMDDFPDDVLSLKTVARTVADKASGSNPGDEEDPEEEDWEDEDEDDWTGKKKEKSLTYVGPNGIEYKRGPWAGRQFGGVVGGSDLDTKTRQQVFVSTLPNSALTALEFVLGETRGEMNIKQAVEEEMATRDYAGMLTSEMKMRMTPNGGGQNGRGGGRHRQAAEGRTPGGGKNFGETGAVKRPASGSVKRTNKAVKRPGTAPRKTVAAARSTSKTVNRMAGGDQTEYKAFPINNVTQLKDAIRASGRAVDVDKARTHIKSRAKALGHEDLIPDSWKTVVIDVAEIKSLEAFVNGL